MWPSMVTSNCREHALERLAGPMAVEEVGAEGEPCLRHLGDRIEAAAGDIAHHEARSGPSSMPMTLYQSPPMSVPWAPATYSRAELDAGDDRVGLREQRALEPHEEVALLAVQRVDALVERR